VPVQPAPEPDGEEGEDGQAPPQPQRVQVRGPAMPKHDEIVRPELNRLNAERILARWSPDAAKLPEGGPAAALLEATAAMILERAAAGGDGRAAFESLTLIGGDRADGRRAFVIRAGFPDGRTGLYRLSAYNAAGQLHHDLLDARWVEAGDADEPPDAEGNAGADAANAGKEAADG